MSALARKTSGIAMVLAAGKGLRMRPLTARRPKPLIEAAGRTLIDRTLDHIVDAGIDRAIVNLHYRGGMLRRHLDRRSALAIGYSDESAELLDTGGGVKKALTRLIGRGERAKPFFVLNSDALWTDTGQNALIRLAEAWDGRRMDALFLLHPTARAVAHAGNGDYRLKQDDRLVRSLGKPAPYVFTGIRILHPRLFKGTPNGAFSIIPLFDAAERRGRLFGLRHQGAWMDVGTPAGLTEAETLLTPREQP